MGFGEFLWVLIVTCIAVYLIRWGMRTDRLRLGGFAITLGAWVWAVLRPDNGGWFLFRPLPLNFTLFIFLLLVVSLAVGFFWWRIAKLIGWVAVFVAVFAPFWDLFTSEFWDDLWPENWSADLFSWPVVVALAVVGIILLVGGLFLRFLLVLGGIALVLALVLGLMNGFNGAPEEVAETPSRSDKGAIDMCITVDGMDDGGAFQKYNDGYVDPEGDGICYTEEESDAEAPVSEPEFTCPPSLVQQPISDMVRKRFIRDGIRSPSTARSWEKFGAALLHDARQLRETAEYFNVPDLPRVRQMLTDNGECLSEAGLDVHDDLMAVGKAMLSSRFGHAPVDGHNSWADKHGYLIINPEKGVKGNRKALVFVDGEGRRRYVLINCGNLVHPSHS